MNYAEHVNEKKTHQTLPIPGSAQVANSAGGFSFAVDDWKRLDRFLILGSEGGSYYASEKKLTLENTAAVQRCVASDGLRTVARIVEISDLGRAPKNDPAILALAYCAKKGDDVTRKAAYAALPKVCRIGTHLMHFAEYAEALGGWGRGMRKAVARWYDDREVVDLARMVTKYQSRDGWSNRDLLRLSKPRGAEGSRDALYHWITKGWESIGAEPHPDEALRVVWAFEKCKRTTSAKEAAEIVREYRLPRECVPTEHLTSPDVWAALLPHMGLTALVRNLATMTRVGLIAPMSDALRTVKERLSDREAIKKARLHPVQILSALLTYKEGRGVRGNSTWEPVTQVVDALDAAFYLAFDAVEPTGKRTLLALDVSGSMSGGECGGVPGLTPRVGSAAMALVTASTEENYGFVGFSHKLVNLEISPRQRLDDVVRSISGIPYGATDCALPITQALERKIPIDTFCVYTDNETFHGNIHPVQALKKYRDAMGIAAKLVVIGMVSNGFTIADPNDAGMMDVVGFDTSTPSVIADFSRS